MFRPPSFFPGGGAQLRKATEQARRATADVRAVAVPVDLGGGGAAQPQVLQIDGCPDVDCNGTYTIQPHKVPQRDSRHAHASFSANSSHSCFCSGFCSVLCSGVFAPFFPAVFVAIFLLLWCGARSSSDYW